MASTRKSCPARSLMRAPTTSRAEPMKYEEIDDDSQQREIQAAVPQHAQRAQWPQKRHRYDREVKQVPAYLSPAVSRQRHLHQVLGNEYGPDQVAGRVEPGHLGRRNRAARVLRALPV
jgi:hypothetical protein